MTAAPRAARPERPALALIFAITVTGIMMNTLVAPSIPEILAAFDAPSTFAGLLIGAGTLPGIVLAPVMGLLADRYGRREVLVPCLVLFGVAGGLGAIAPSIWVLILLRLLQGIGASGMINLAVVLLGDHWSGIERARVIGYNSGVLTGSLAVLPAVGGTLTGLAGWRAPFALYPVAVLTAWLVATRLPQGTRRDARVRDQLREALPLLRTSAALVTFGMTTVIFALIFGLLLTVLPVYLQQAFGVRPGLRGVLLGLPALGNTVAALSLGRLRRRFSGRDLIATGTGLLAAALVLLTMAPTLRLVVAAVLLFSIGEGLLLPNLQDTAVGIGPASSRGTVVAVFVSSARLGQTTGPLAGGIGLGTLGAQGTFAAGAAAGGALLTVALAMRRQAARLASTSDADPAHG